jgi:hypothetical protein
MGVAKKRGVPAMGTPQGEPGIVTQKRPNATETTMG